MANNRIYYAIQQVAIKADGGTAYYPVFGLQSVGVTTNFNLSQVFQMGQLSLYENIEELPDVQMTLSKVLDGYCPIYCLATQQAGNPTLPARALQKCLVNLAIFDESQTSASGVPVGIMETSGMYVTSVRYQFPKDGNFTEEVTLAGGNKVWFGDSRINSLSPEYTWANTLTSMANKITGLFDGAGSPIGVGGVNRRQDMRFQVDGSSGLINSIVKDPDATVLPPDVAGISTSGANNMSDANRAHINSISVSVNLNRDNITELGRKGPYCRIPTFPTEVTTEIEITATSGDIISATENGILSNNNTNCASDSGNVVDRTIRLTTCEGLRVFCGNKNRLASVNYNGGDTGGGYINISYTFNTYNDFVVLHSGENQLTGYKTYANDSKATNIKAAWAARANYLI